jgi:hypothetical protein
VRTRNSLLVGAALLAALAAGCKRAPEPAPAPDPTGGATLTAPQSIIASQLGAATTGYTNEMQEANLRDQAAALGISRFARPSNALGSESEGTHPTITYQEGLARTRELEGEIEAERHAIEKDKNKTVAIPSQTPAIISGDKQGSPIESGPADAGPKDPENK